MILINSTLLFLRRLKWLHFIIALCCLNLLISPLTHALNGVFDQTFYSGNNIVRYDPRYKKECKVASTATTALGNTVTEKIWNYLIDRELTPEQTAGIMGNMEAESGLTPTRHQGTGEIWNSSGTSGNAWGIVQWDGTRRYKLEIDGTEGGILGTIRTNKPSLVKYTDIAYDTVRNPSAVIPDEDLNALLFIELDYMVAESEGTLWTSLKQQSTVYDATKYWMLKFERPRDQSESAIQARTVKSQVIYDTYVKTVAPPTGSTATATTSDACVGGQATTGSSSSVINTIKQLAWPYALKGLGMDQNSDAKPEYQTAAAAYTYAQALTDCTIFVSTVMKTSSADPGFPTGTTTIRQYLVNNPKYEIIYNPTLDQLQPGDIMQNVDAGSSSTGSWSGHILIYTGDLDGTNQFIAADASKYTRVPGYLTSVAGMLASRTDIAARLKTSTPVTTP